MPAFANGNVCAFVCQSCSEQWITLNVSTYANSLDEQAHRRATCIGSSPTVQQSQLCILMAICQPATAPLYFVSDRSA